MSIEGFMDILEALGESRLRNSISPPVYPMT